MLTPAEADAAIAAALEPVSQEEVPLAACAGRILRAPLLAERDAPPFDRVTMDGIALSSAGGPRDSYRVAGIQAAGMPALTLATAEECIEVMTGALLPTGCDCVVPVEQLDLDDGRAGIRPGFVPVPWLHVHRQGADAHAGARLLQAGTRLDAPALAIAASAGRARLPVARALRIAVVTTGDELVEPGAPILGHQVRRSNAYGIGAALTLSGFPPASDLQLPDRRQLIERGLGTALEGHDLLVISGGVSAGRYDYVPAALEAIGVRKVLHGIAQRPGRPMWFGVSTTGSAVFALPGNPVSVLVCLARYVVPALARLTGASVPARAAAVLARAFAFDAPLTCFLPVALGYDQLGRALAEPRPTGGSGDFVALAGTDGFVELPRGPATHAAGLAVPFYRW
jgi:molybdopterin molybdotransferase